MRKRDQLLRMDIKEEKKVVSEAVNSITKRSYATEDRSSEDNLINKIVEVEENSLVYADTRPEGYKDDQIYTDKVSIDPDGQLTEAQREEQASVGLDNQGKKKKEVLGTLRTNLTHKFIVFLVII